MNNVRLTFKESITRTESVTSFRFVPEEPILFEPGQFLQLLFDENNKNNKELNKYLSFSCAPGKEYVEVTKRLSLSMFSERLRSLRPGACVLAVAPLGNCVFKDDYAKIGFLIGGIGITPVISIIEYIIMKKLSTDVCLLYSNRRENDIAFKKELTQWRKAHSTFRIVFTVTDCEPVDQLCMVGFISRETIISHMVDWKDRVIFVFGPPAMVNGLKYLCHDLSCDPAKIKTENFLGY